MGGGAEAFLRGQGRFFCCPHSITLTQVWRARTPKELDQAIAVPGRGVRYAGPKRKQRRRAVERGGGHAAAAAENTGAACQSSARTG